MILKLTFTKLLNKFKPMFLKSLVLMLRLIKKKYKLPMNSRKPFRRSSGYTNIQWRQFIKQRLCLKKIMRLLLLSINMNSHKRSTLRCKQIRQNEMEKLKNKLYLGKNRHKVQSVILIYKQIQKFRVICKQMLLLKSIEWHRLV